MAQSVPLTCVVSLSGLGRMIHCGMLLLGMASALTTRQLHPLTIVVGKIIVDDYGDPGNDENKPLPPKSVSIGGGGPQAAWGAAAALALHSLYSSAPNTNNTNSSSSAANVMLRAQLPTPPTQPVLFVGPVGNDWKIEDSEELSALLHDAIQEAPILLQGNHQEESFITPRIRIWHDNEQDVRWYAVNDSFGPKGADGLWRNRPTAQDILDILDEHYGDNNVNASSCMCTLHLIAEAGDEAAGCGLDSKWLKSDNLRQRLKFVGVEPIAFRDPTVGRVSNTDAESCAHLLHQYWLTNVGDDKESPRQQPFVLCPDIHLDRAMRELNLHGKNTQTHHENQPPVHDGQDNYIVATRDGANGSVLTPPWSSLFPLNVPAATLVTPDQEPVNPTGAGNAFAAAFTALLGATAPLDDHHETEDEFLKRLRYCAAISTGVGACVCETRHIPTWSWESLDRIWEAAQEVQTGSWRDVKVKCQK